MALTLSKLQRAASISMPVSQAPFGVLRTCLRSLITLSSAVSVVVDSLEGSDGFTRHNFNAIVSQRDLHETFLPAFQTCVAADPEQIMCRYAAVCYSCFEAF